MNKPLSIGLLVFLWASVLLPQSTSIDSLLNLLPESDDSTKVDLMNEIAENYGSDEIDKKIAIATEALSLSEKIDYRFGIGMSLFTLGKAYHLQDEYYKGMNFYQKAETVFRKLNETHLLGLTYINHGVAYNDMGNRDSSYLQYVKAVEQLEKTDDTEELSNVLTKIGLQKWRWTEYTEALNNHQRALQLRKQIGKAKLIAESFNNIGVIYYKLGKYDLALDSYLKAYEIQDSLGNGKSLVYIMNNIGLIYLDRDEFPEAEKSFHEGLRVAEKNEHLYGIAYSLQNLATSYEVQEKSDSALILCTDALRLIEDNDLNQYTRVQLKIASGRIHQKSGNTLKAVEFYQNALTISKSIPYVIGEAEAKKHLGLLYIKQQNFSRAENYLLDALELVKNENLRPYMRDYLRDLYELELQKGDHESALDYYVKYSAIQDSIEHAANSEKTSYLLVQFQTERKELENIKLRTEIEREILFRNSIIIITIMAFLLVGLLYNRFRMQRKAHTQTIEQKKEVEKLNVELNEANTTKDKFFSIIAHDLNNPFFAILSLSKILKSDRKKLPEEKLDHLIGLLKESAESTYDLLKNLLDWSRSQRGVIDFEPEELYLLFLAKKVAKHLKQQAENKQITIALNIPETLVVFVDNNMITTVLLNLVSNAIKFSHKESEVNIRAEQTNEAVVVSVVDNGVGMPKEVVQKLFRIDKNVSTVGTEDEKGSGLGLILCKEFVEKHNGEIRVESTEGKGSTFSFSLPVKRLTE